MFIVHCSLFIVHWGVPFFCIFAEECLKIHTLTVMKEMFGKWLMDIAKYMATALLLSSAFGEMDRWWIVLVVLLGTVFTLVIGLLLQRPPKDN